MLEFDYVEVPSGLSFRPVVPLFLEGPNGRFIIDVLVDSGADTVELDTRLAQQLGVRLSAKPTGSIRSSSGDIRPYFDGKITLELRRSGSIVRWSTLAAFTERPVRNLLGQRGGLEFFHAHFLGPERRLILEEQPNLPIPQ
jgi:hypothetical protein